MNRRRFFTFLPGALAAAAALPAASGGLSAKQDRPLRELALHMELSFHNAQHAVSRPADWKADPGLWGRHGDRPARLAMSHARLANNILQTL